MGSPGFGALLKGLTSVVDKSCRSRDSNPQPRDALSTRPRLPPWHGIPKELVCDHVPFAGYEMKTFAAEWGINLTHSSPVYPQSNGLAERTIKTVKQRGTIRGGSSPCSPLAEKYSYHWYVLLTSSGSDGKSSEEHQCPATPKGVHQPLQNLQKKQACHYNVGAKALPELHAGNTVHIETDRAWQRGLIVSKRDEPRSYNVVNEAGQQFHHNRRHLRKTNHKHTETFDAVDETHDDAQCLYSVCQSNLHITAVPQPPGGVGL